jgi:hypothetical protein
MPVASPGSPFCTGRLPVPWVMPDSGVEAWKMFEVRYGLGSCPASPYATRSFPNVSQGR